LDAKFRKAWGSLGPRSIIQPPPSVQENPMLNIALLLPIAVLLIAFVIIVAFQPSDFKISRNAVISAHRDRHFSRLDELQLGDTIHTETATGRSSWVIVARRVVGRDAPALFQSREPRLTLTTCWPVRYFGSAPDRLILSAKLVAGSFARGTSMRSGDT